MLPILCQSQAEDSGILATLCSNNSRGNSLEKNRIFYVLQGWIIQLCIIQWYWAGLRHFPLVFFFSTLCYTWPPTPAPRKCICTKHYDIIYQENRKRNNRWDYAVWIHDERLSQMESLSFVGLPKHKQKNVLFSRSHISKSHKESWVCKTSRWLNTP